MGIIMKIDNSARILVVFFRFNLIVNITIGFLGRFINSVRLRNNNPPCVCR